jgi:GDP-4-dehydro-6-deoxy-D-mannose reductase
MKKKILITGISGFAGSFLAEHLLAKGDSDIFGTTLSLKESPNLAAIQDRITLHEVNLLNFEDVSKMIAQIQPDEIYHLAALASPSLSFKNPAETITNNIAAQVNVFEAVRNHSKNMLTKILIVSSADVYGKVEKENLPIDEDTPFHPANPYAVSKIAQDYLALQYYSSYQLHIIRVRPFNHIGPRQAPFFVVPDFAKQIAEIEKNKKEPIMRVGNLEAKRDFTDVRDMVRAYDLILEKGKPGDVYNIGSGISHTIRKVLDTLRSFSTTEITIEQNPELMRPSDTPELVCDPKKMHQRTGWKAEIPFEKTLKDTLDYWRKIV